MDRRVHLLCAAVLAALVFAACSHASAPKAIASAQPAGTATVERVVDGDTIIVHVGGRRERVRFIGMDTPVVAG